MKTPPRLKVPNSKCATPHDPLEAIAALWTTAPDPRSHASDLGHPARTRSLVVFALSLLALVWVTGSIGQPGPPPSGLVGLWPGYLRGNVTSVTTHGNYAYVGMTLSGPGGCSRGWRGRLEVIDISDPNRPVWLSALDFREPIVRLQATNGVMYAASGRTLSVFTVTNAATPVLIGQCETDDNVQWFQLRGQYVYAVRSGNLDVFDVSNPDQPVRAGSTNALGSGSSIQVMDHYAYVATGNGLRVFNVSVPSLPVLLTTNQNSTVSVQAVDIAGGYAYLMTAAGLQILSITNPSQPVVVGTNAAVAYGYRILTAGPYCYAAVGNRLEVLDVNDPAHPGRVGSYDVGATASDLVLADHYAFVAAGAEGLQILNLTNPASPAFVAIGTRETGGPAEAIQVVGNYAYLADGDSGLQVIDLANSNGLVRVGHLRTTNYARAINIVLNRAYVGTDAGLKIIDVTDPAKPLPVGSFDYSFDYSGPVMDVQVVGNLAYLTGGPLQIVDVSIPAQPGLITNCAAVSSSRAVKVVGQLAYVTGGINPASNQGFNGLAVIDVLDPAAPRLVGSCPTLETAQDVHVVGNLAYVNTTRWPDASGRPASWLEIIDVANPAQPTPLGRCSISEDAHRIQVVGHYAYIAGGSWREDAPVWRDGLMVVDVSDPANPMRVGGFTTPGWAAGVQVVGDQVYLADGPAGLAVLTLPAVPTGPLAVEIKASSTNVVMGYAADFTGWVDGWVSTTSWDFGDGTTLSNRLDVSHAWAAPGNYTVALRAYNESNPGGVSTSLTVQVVPIRVTLVVPSAKVMTYDQTKLSAVIEGNASAIVWDFGDGLTLTNGTETTHTWTIPGDYTVVVRAYNESAPNGVSASALVQVVARPIHYVAAMSTTPVPPYTSWATAARNIQDAVDAADPALWPPGSVLVLVSNGVYATGGRAVVGTMMNRVVVDKPLKLMSVNGPAVTHIVGSGELRCVYLTHEATLAGFTIRNGGTQTSGEHDTHRSGGGVWCEDLTAKVSNCVLTNNSANMTGGAALRGTLEDCIITRNSALMDGGGVRGSLLNNCVLTSNSAVYVGGGAYLATLNNCTLTSNSAGWYGGGADSGTLNNCTLTGNSAGRYGGGAAFGTVNNCIVYYNTAAQGPNYYGGSDPNFCCTTPLPAAGVGNFTNAPLFVDYAGGNLRLQSNSLCINAGDNAYATGPTDLDGNPRLVGGFVDIGAYEYQLNAPVPLFAVSIQAAYTGVLPDFPLTFTAQICGHATSSHWDFGDGTVVSNQLPGVSHSWTALGDYLVTLRTYNDSHPDGVSATVTVHVVTSSIHYVAATNATPSPPYTSWETAATNIQDAVDAADGAWPPGSDLVLVTNGVYASGGRAVGTNVLINRVAIDKPLTLRSVNGPQFTVIQGYQVPGTTNGDGAIRCVYLADGASLSGFTLTRGATRIVDRDQWPIDSQSSGGGGVWCESTNAMISDCVLAGNSAYMLGGGAWGGTLNNCMLVTNSARNGGGAWGSSLNHCTLKGNSALWGGGAADGRLNRCTLTGNSASGNAGGAGGCFLINCILKDNRAGIGGGGTYDSTLNNCTLIGNRAVLFGGGAYDSKQNNCIIYFNTAQSGPNYASTYDIPVKYCCSTPMPTNGVGNVTGAPLFVDYANGDLRLQSNSPCINAGNNSYLTDSDFTNSFDLDGNPRIVSGTVDIGAYEFQGPGSVISYAWLQQFGLSTDGSADATDLDADGHTVWQEWRCQTCPTNAHSGLRLLSATLNGTNVTVSWQSVVGVRYLLERSTNLSASPPFLPLASDIAGQSGTTSFTDTNAAFLTPLFYRMGVP